MAHPPRHDCISYVDRETFLITAITRDRAKVFENLEFGRNAMQTITAIASKHKIALPAYTYMPDHAHVVTRGLSDDSDVRKFVYDWKKETGYQWSRLGNGKLWQPGYWDSHMRHGEDAINLIDYVVLNPVRAKLVSDPAAYPLTGSSVYTMDQMMRLLGITFVKR